MPDNPLFAIRLGTPFDKQYDTGFFGSQLSPIARMNIFIGPNNAGKSRLLRHVFSCANSLEMSGIGNNHNKRVDTLQKAAGVVNDSVAKDKLKKRYRDGLNLMYATYADPASDTELTAKVEQFIRDVVIGEPIATLYRDRFGENLRNALEAVENIRRAPQALWSRPNWKAIYVPTLRGFRTPAKDKDFFTRRTVNDYFSQHGHLNDDFNRPAEERSVFSGHDMFEVLTSRLLGSITERKSIAQFQQLLGKHFFENREVVLIPRHKTESVFVKIGDDEEFPIHELGDDIQQLIVMLFPIFLHGDKPLMTFIEEPETHLHPAFQRIFVDFVVAAQNPNLHVFVTTHSHQFLDLTLEQSSCTVFRVSKRPPQPQNSDAALFQVEVVSSNRRPILADLGVHNSSILLANCTVWVEGISDRLYIRTILQHVQAYEKTFFLEDIHFSFVEYGGGNLEHFGFSDEASADAIRTNRICPDVLVIADEDERKEEKHARMRAVLQERYLMLEVREIENLLSPKIIQDVIRQYEGSDVSFKEFQQSDYSKIGLGTFIETSVLAKPSTRRSAAGHPYAEDSGTIKDKVKFCQRATAAISSFEDLSPEAISLGRKILDFVKQCNPATLTNVGVASS